MCRWLAYCGEPLRPSELILHPEHSLIAQSLDSPLGAETVNGDGFGFGWYPAGPRAGNAPAVFRSTEPAWNDQNLRELTQAVESPLSNGAVAGFGSVKRDLTFAVDPSLYPHITGTTDSEVLLSRLDRGAARGSGSRDGQGHPAGGVGRARARGELPDARHRRRLRRQHRIRRRDRLGGLIHEYELAAA